MAGPPSKFSAKIALLFVLIPLCAVVWYAAPLFAPVWLWQNVKWEAIAHKTSIPEATLRQQSTITFRHAPRGPDDPVPWQIITTDPVREGEDHVMVRAVIISDRTGQPVSAFNLGSGNFRDRYFIVKGWRFPAGTFAGLNAQRPVVVFDSYSLEKPDTGKCMFWEAELRDSAWTSDDEDIEDGWVAPDQR